LDPGVDGSGSGSGSGGNGSAGKGHAVRQIFIKYATGANILKAIQPLAKKGETLLFDETSNSVILRGGDSTYEAILETMKLIDHVPQEILIEAQVVETSNNFLRALGLSYSNQAASGSAVAVNAPGPSGANALFHYFGTK